MELKNFIQLKITQLDLKVFSLPENWTNAHYKHG